MRLKINGTKRECMYGLFVCEMPEEIDRLILEMVGAKCSQ